ncbi:MAG: RNA-binding protein [Methanobrevibacter sp.]|jgi:DNA/RNA endonuclease YhcR with UshA esterase domain|nr:RNA-binding protein [Candidatus Methanovirga aequatorialis]
MEITDEKIFKIALFTALVGILGMIIFTGGVESKEVKIKEIGKAMIGEKIAIKGVVESVKQSSSGKSYFLSINDGTGKINVVIFESALLKLQNNGIDVNKYVKERVKVFGTVTEYGSVMELSLDSSNSIKII